MTQMNQTPTDSEELTKEDWSDSDILKMCAVLTIILAIAKGVGLPIDWTTVTAPVWVPFLIGVLIEFMGGRDQTP